MTLVRSDPRRLHRAWPCQDTRDRWSLLCKHFVYESRNQRKHTKWNKGVYEGQFDSNTYLVCLSVPSVTTTNSRLQLSKSKLTKGKTNGSLNPRTDATVNTGSKHEKIAPNKIILPTRGSTGNVAKWYPSGVSSSFASSAFYNKQHGSTFNFSLPHWLISQVNT